MDWSNVVFQGWQGIARVLVVGAIAYVALVAFLRLSGKRTLSKLNAFDLVVTVALGSTLSAVLLQKSIPLVEGLVALGLLILMQFVVTFFSVRSRWFADAIRSEPALLARNGAFCREAMKRERVTEDETLSAVRSSGGHGIADVETVILESDGSISVALARRPSADEKAGLGASPT